MEWIKLRSVRSTWWLAIAAVLSMAAAGGGVGLGYRSHTPVATAAQILNNSLGGAIAAQLFLGALGVLVMTGEYGTGMIRSTLAAVPRRGIVLAAKVAVGGGAALTIGLVASFAGYLSGQFAIRGTAIPAASLGDPAILRAVLLTGVYLGATALIGVGIGTMVRHSGAAIGTLFGLTFVPMVAIGLFGESGIAVGRYRPAVDAAELDRGDLARPRPVLRWDQRAADVRVRGGGSPVRRRAAPPARRVSGDNGRMTALRAPFTALALRQTVFCVVGVVSAVAILAVPAIVPALGVLVVWATGALSNPDAPAVGPVFLVGFPLTLALVVVLAAPIGRAMGAVHRALADRLLDVRVDAPPPRTSKRVGALVSDGPGWRAVGYGLLKVPLAVPEGYGAFCYVFGLVNLSYPVWWPLFRNHPSGTSLGPVRALTPFGAIEARTFAGTFAIAAAGFAMLLVAPWLMRAGTDAGRGLPCVGCSARGGSPSGYANCRSAGPARLTTRRP
jgi:hypothetical protein